MIIYQEVETVWKLLYHIMNRTDKKVLPSRRIMRKEYIAQTQVKVSSVLTGSINPCTVGSKDLEYIFCINKQFNHYSRDVWPNLRYLLEW